MRVFLIIVGVVVVGCMCLCGVVLAAFVYSQNQYNTQLDDANAAYDAGDCQTATTGYADVVAQSFFDSETVADQEAILAKQEQCEIYLQGVDAQTSGRYGDALVAYAKVSSLNASAIHLNNAETQITDLLNTAQGSDAVNVSACAADVETGKSAVATLLEKDILPDSATNHPKLLLACGEVLLQSGNFNESVTTLTNFMATYPDHELSEQAEEQLAAAIVAEAEAVGAPEISQPEAVAGSNADAAVLIIENASPEGIRLTFVGEETQVEQIPACDTCVEFDSSPEGCPETDKTATFELPPGTYQVVVESIGEFVTPYRGTWDLEAGSEYPQCFFIVLN